MSKQQRTQHNYPNKKPTKKSARGRAVVVVLGIVLVAIIAIALVAFGDEINRFAASFMSPQATGVTPVEILEGEATVAFISCGMADSTLVLAGDTVVLIDAGDKDSFPDIRNTLNQFGVSKIDVLVATHPHADHIGSMAEVIANYDIGEILFADIPQWLQPTNYTYTTLLDTIESYDVPLSIAHAGDDIPVALGKMTVLAGGGHDDLNNCSLVVRYEYGNTAFLFMGDCEGVVESELIAAGANIECDVLKAGHHGTYRATTADFLKFAAPAYVISSCGIDNQYGFPHREVRERVAAQGALLLRTDYDGTVVFITDGNNVWQQGA